MKNCIDNQIKENEISKYLDKGNDFIKEQLIYDQLKNNQKFDKKQINDILEKSLSLQTLTTEEVAVLINVKDKDILLKMQEIALKIKKKVYDNRIVTFAPLYTGNICVNDCLYCGFRKSNNMIKRQILSLNQIKEEVKVLVGEIGHKRLIVVYGESSLTDIDYIIDSIKEIYNVKIDGKHCIRRVNINAPVFCIDKLKLLQKVGIGTYQVFQETYHKKTYENVHPKGTIKSNYRWRLYAMHRAFEAGIDDVGLGVLFGLYNWKFEIMGLISHVQELEKRFNIGPHTISFPRIERSINTPFNDNLQYKVNDLDFKKIITIIRLAVPYTGMILTARENSFLRDEILSLGVTQIDASTKIGIGLYSKKNEQTEEKQQFILQDTRSLETIIKELAKKGLIVSFCTAGYRCGRTGEKIMDTLRNGQERIFCKLNAIITYKEWIDDFASIESKKISENLIKKEIKEVQNKYPNIFTEFLNIYNKTVNGERDLFF